MRLLINMVQYVFSSLSQMSFCDQERLFGYWNVDDGLVLFSIKIIFMSLSIDNKGYSIQADDGTDHQNRWSGLKPQVFSECLSVKNCFLKELLHNPFWLIHHQFINLKTKVLLRVFSSSGLADLPPIHKSKEKDAEKRKYCYFVYWFLL